MKKLFISIICLILPLLSFTGCKNTSEVFLTEYVSDLRSDIYQANLGEITITAYLKKSENPILNDGKVGKTYTSLLFKLPISEPDKTYTLNFTHNDTDFESKFAFDPLSNCLTAEIFPESFSDKSFTATISVGGDKSEFNFNSVIPENTVKYVTALESLYSSQKTLIDDLCENGNFNGELSARLIINKEQPYWYVAVITEASVKAMLFDGFTADILAVKDIY